MTPRYVVYKNSKIVLRTNSESEANQEATKIGGYSGQDPYYQRNLDRENGVPPHYEGCPQYYLTITGPSGCSACGGTGD